MAASKKISKQLKKTQTYKPPPLTPADKACNLVARYRDFDERQLCFECTNAIRPGGVWTCTKWQAAGVGAPPIGLDLIRLFHRCDAFHNFDEGDRRGSHPSTDQKITRKSQL